MASMVTCCPKLSAAGMPGASVPGILLRIFLQNCRMSLQDVSRSFSRTARSAFSCPACRNARKRPTSTAMQSKALWVNCTKTGQDVSTDATGAERLLEVEAHSDVVSQLHGAVLRLLRQVDAVEVLQERADGQTERVRHQSVKSLFTTNLIVFDSLGQRLHVDRLVQLVFVQQVDEEIQGTLMDAHLRVQRADLLVDLHAALSQRPESKKQKIRTQAGFSV